jgi:hypothetical protein
MVIITAANIEAQKLLPYRQIPKNVVTRLSDWISKGSSEKPSKITFFRLGKTLKFGLHGMSGIFATLATGWALMGEETEVSVLAAVFWGSLTAIHASFLLRQVPPASHVAPGIVAPHIDAFKAAIGLIFYVDVRCLQPYFPSDLLYMTAVIAAWWPFVPAVLDWYNWNTYLLVLPRFLAVTFDMMNIVATGQSLPRQDLLSVQMFLLVFSFLYSLSFRVKHKAMPMIIYFVTTLGGAALAAFIVMPEVFRVFSFSTNLIAGVNQTLASFGNETCEPVEDGFIASV